MGSEVSKISIADLSPHLFWDVEAEKLTMDANMNFIISRVLDYGKIKDWMLIRKYYGIDRIAEVAKSLRNLDDRAWMFIASLADIPPESFRCYTTKQSMPRQPLNP